jgi:hypothetical protein
MKISTPIIQTININKLKKTEKIASKKNFLPHAAYSSRNQIGSREIGDKIHNGRGCRREEGILMELSIKKYETKRVNDWMRKG